jgi:hypothetical protein
MEFPHSEFRHLAALSGDFQTGRVFIVTEEGFLGLFQ